MLFCSSVVVSFFGRRDGEEILRDSFGINLQKLAYSFVFFRIKNQPDVFRLGHSVNDLVVGVVRCVRRVGLRESEGDAGEIFTQLRQLVWLLVGRDPAPGLRGPLPGPEPAPPGPDRGAARPGGRVHGAGG